MNTFPRQRRLLKAGEYRHVFAQQQKIKCHGLIGYIGQNPYNGPRLGLVLAKRQIKLAVGRNRIKRLIRESFRQHQQQLPKVDIIVVALQHLKTLSNTEIFQRLETLWQRSNEFQNKAC